jgi:OmpA-OmpF porin, OOP family
MRLLLCIAVVGTAMAMPALWPAAAQAQTPDEIISALRPPSGSGPTRGIRPVGPTAAPPADEPAPSAGPPAYAPAASRPAGTASSRHAPRLPERQSAEPAGTVNLVVNFATGSAQLTPQATRTLDALGRALSSRSLADYRFRIEGHTDSVGGRDLNLALSQRRAAAVAEYVSRHYGVDPSRLEVVGVGPDQPLVPTPDGVAEPRNRRVQVVNLGA